MKVAILGAGNVALANACYLAQSGHEVVIWSAFEHERAALTSRGTITAEGVISGEFEVRVAKKASSCIAGAPLVMIAAPAFGHETLMSAAADHLTAEQDVMVHPVTGLSSLILSRKMKARGVKPTIVDVSTSGEHVGDVQVAREAADDVA